MTAAEIESAVARADLRPLGSEVIRRFQIYLELLEKWNSRLNLTAIREPDEILQRHFIECIFAARHLPTGIKTLLDFGSGGGFPGLPIALCRPEVHVTLGESQSKKAAFLREASRTLELPNAEVYNGRVESLDRSFDAVTLRAVDKMQEACRVAVEKLQLGGHFILFLTEETSSPLISQFQQIDWSAPIRLPGSSQRQLLMGQRSGTFHVEHSSPKPNS
ncbi:16S rRNA (guanine(527)-N(7))-methyltransferase RsmG [Alloacidobacterium dinghuense]|uniref:Ribosomal RNA small subunit methyltransferase G n=1 Tax=Alloacidobacterium dinghuense TaxID=2763107 RepID=A0A7G8BG62_9BACT|nr:16S rRNA (guanine(527)-N(7))-methyltransferase RsmG [Alloacidobacterium dinghuense]QNI31532.1 16S rRNA (guanine(527)-N(7))-methyltransferase RsmG [Alloacidobacterium dinghuense]